MTALRCIYRLDGCAGLAGSAEHLILNSLGGIKTTASMCCQPCNERLGATVDQPLAEQFRFLANQIGISTGRGRPAPMLRGLDSGKGYMIDIEPGGRPKLSGAKVTCEGTVPGEHGKEHRVQISARNRDELLRLLNGQRRRFRAEPDGVKMIDGREHWDYVEPIPVSFSFGGEFHFRSCTKMMLNLLAAKTDPQRLRGAEFEAIVEYIARGRPLPKGWVGHDYSDQFPNFGSLPDFGHRVAVVTSDTARTAIGFLELFECFRVSAVLSADWSGPQLAYTYSVDPVLGQDEEAAPVVDAPDIEYLLAKRPRDAAPATDAAKRLLQKVSRRHTAAAIKNLVDEVFRERFKHPASGQPPSEISWADLAPIISETVRRYVLMARRVDRVERIDIDDK